MSIDASVGTETANSYVTVEEADAYFADRSGSANWETIVDKEARLITASRLLDWYLSFKGSKVSFSQSMQFPRYGMVSVSGNEYPSTLIPNEVKFAVFELTLSSLSGDRTMDNSLAGIEQVKAGSLFIKATPAGYNSTKASVIPEHIQKLLSDLVAQGNVGVVRLMRA